MSLQQASPVWCTREELRLVLAGYRKLYEQGWSDRDISIRIRALYIKPREVFYEARRRGGKPR